MSMDYEKLNPCGYPRVVRFFEWAETGCWCCTSLRALLVGILIGFVGAFAVFGAWKVAILAALVGTPIVMVLLYVAREIWQESYSDDQEGPPL